LIPPAKPDGPTQPGKDPAAEFLDRAGKAASGIRDFIKFTPVVLYFFLYWTPKELVRRAFRTGSLAFLSLSAVLLWIEVIAELGEHQVLRLVPGSRYLGLPFRVVFTLAVVGLLRHHSRERSHRHSEYLLSERVWEFMITRGAASWDECISTTLPLFFDVFGRFKVSHLSIALPDGEHLRIRPEHVYPPESDPSYYPKLPLHDGVAGHVYTDGKPRYVPRLFFPHAMIFEIRKVEGKHIDIVRPKLDLDAFKTEDFRKFAFKSFITVPLKPVGHSEIIGVLNIDFKSTDPLDRIHAKTAVFLGVVLADELRRIREAAGAPLT
jgi:hypothetical protein